MTLILAQSCRGFSLAVSDRRVTYNGSVFDPISNKSIIFVARDAILSFNYTGLAFLEGVNTDQWLTEIIINEKFPRNAKVPSLRLGNGSCPELYVGPTLDRIVSALRNCFSKITPPNSEMKFEIIGSGWKWSRRNAPNPFIVTILKKKNDAEFKVEWSYRHVGRGFISAATPEENLTSKDRENFVSGLRKIKSPDDAESTMVETIRSVSERLIYVGKDCMSIFLPHPSIGFARVKYISASPSFLELRSSTNAYISPPTPAAFSPWIVSEGLVHAPSIIAGESIFEIGNFNIKMEAPPLPPTGILGAMGSIQRRPPPRN